MIQNVQFFLPRAESVTGPHIGVVLVHGLTGTPNEMKMVGMGLNQAGYTVQGVQLAGHCGSVDDLNATTWQDWYASVEQAVEVLALHVDTVVVAGLSMGALLALKVAADRPELVSGVMAYAPPLRYDGWSVPFYAQRLYLLLPWFKRLKLFQRVVFIEKPPFGLKDEALRARVVQSMNSGDSTGAGLAGNPFPALAEMVLLSKATQQALPAIKQPVLLVHARDDDIAHMGNSLDIQRRVSGPTQLVILDNSYHLVTIDLDHQRTIAESVRFLQSLVLQSLAQSPALTSS